MTKIWLDGREEKKPMKYQQWMFTFKNPEGKEVTYYINLKDPVQKDEAVTRMLRSLRKEYDWEPEKFLIIRSRIGETETYYTD